jgi:glycine/D-amino acid oxidase-like deaminating enzyme
LLPDLDPALATDADCVVYPDEAWVAAPVLVSRLLHAARRRDCRVSYPQRVESIEISGDRVVGVATASGERLRADVVVDCSGPAAGQLIKPLGIRIGRERSPGLLVVTNDAATSIDRIVHLDDVHLRPDGAGRIRLGAVDLDERVRDADVDAVATAISAEALRRAQIAFPALGAAQAESIRLGWRPMPADGRTAVGPVPGLPGYYLIFTHSGVTLGPLLGKLAAAEILGDREIAQLAPFRPDRLVHKV